jgi:hypothetical protein
MRTPLELACRARFQTRRRRSLNCGAHVAAGQKRCSECHAVSNRNRLRQLQAIEADLRRVTGKHPSRAPETRTRISETQRAQWSARRQDGAGSGFTGSPSEFQRLILPLLAGMSPTALAAATAFGRILRIDSRWGRVLDVRHWDAFQLAGRVSRSAQEAASPPM